MDSSNFLRLLPVVAALISVGACSSSSSDKPLEAQAVDGYIVGGSVFCDGNANGTTAVAGAFTCPAGTQLNKVSGGYDVGTDALATTSDISFTGVLTGHAADPYVSPLTTLAVAMAQDASDGTGTFDLALHENAKIALARTLGIDPGLMNSNPAENVEAAKSNAKLHQILAAFAPNTASYEAASSALASVISDTAETGGSLSLSAGVQSTVQSINQKLVQSSSPLAKATADLDQLIVKVQTAAALIDLAESPSQVAKEAQKATIDQAPVTINRAEATVTLQNSSEDTGSTSAGQNVLADGSTVVGISDFENPIRVDGFYSARLYSGLTNVVYDNGLFQFNEHINSAQFSVGFEIKSVTAGDQRSISFFSDDVVISAIKGQPGSLEIEMSSDDSTFSLYGLDEAGVITKAVMETSNETISSNGSSLTINIEKIRRKLESLGYEDLLERSGDYAVTLVISDLRINEQNGNVVSAAKEFTVKAGENLVSGVGFRGYLSVIR